MSETVLFLTAGDIKQYFYCPRIVYFRYLMPDFKAKTYKMEEGKRRQAEEIRLEKRRTLSRFGIKIKYGKRFVEESEIQKCFEVRLKSEKLGLIGVVDMAVITPSWVFPVDFKDGSFSVGEVVPLHHKYQLLTYGLLLEETYGKRAEKGFIYSLEDGSTKEVFFTEGARKFLMGIIKKIREVIEREIFPKATPYVVRCKECEFRPVCRG